MRFLRKSILVDFFLFALLALVIATISFRYISTEKYFYFWDFANYSNQTSDLVSAFHVSILEGIRLIHSSLSNDYNKLPCLALVPFIFVFGDSRLVYIVSSALVYILPFALVMGRIATKIIPVNHRAVFWLTAFLTILIPPTWIPILRGYPDLGAAVIIGLAILVYLKDVKLKHWWQISLIGFLLALAILFRRHFAYSARAFLGTIILQSLLIFFSEVRNNRRRALHNLIRYVILISLIAISSLATLTILAPTFTEQILTTNYRSLYASYEASTFVVFKKYGEAYGWLTWLLALLGFCAGILTPVLIRPAIFFIAIY